MYKKFRETQTGVEWWNTLLKRTEVFPVGVDPNSEPETNTELLIEPIDYQLRKMTIVELKAFAEEQGIDIPSDLTKKADIGDYIIEQLTAADAQ